MNFKQNEERVLPSGRTMDDWLNEMCPKIVEEPIVSSNWVKGQELHFFLNFKPDMFDIVTQERYPDTQFLLFKQSVIVKLPNYQSVLFKGQKVDLMIAKISFQNVLNALRIPLMEAKGHYIEIKMRKNTKRDFSVTKAQIVDIVDEKTLEVKIIKQY